VNKILIISTACIVDVNRTVYKILSEQNNVELHLLIPFREKEVITHNGISDYKHENFNIYISKLVGKHPRLEHIKNLKQIIDEIKPTSILLEFDIATLMLKQAIKYSRKYKSKVSIIELENFNRNFIKEAFISLLDLKIKNFIGGIFAQYLLLYNKKQVYKIFCPSNDTVESMKNFGLKDNLYKIPLGINNDIFYPYPLKKIQDIRSELNLKFITIGYFGRIMKEKGIDLLLDALNNLKHLNWNLLVDNFSHYESDYIGILKNKIIKYNLTERVIYFDALHNEMPKFINSTDIVVLPSITTDKFKEQYGRVIAEALCCGKIVVASNTGALPEIVSNAGFLFEQKNVSELSTLLEYIILNLNEIRDSYEVKIQNHVFQNLTAKKQAEIIYKELINTD
jgi:glycosyltransferase involved in cell wall biosynthesis